jgi:cold shock protein
VATGTVIRFDTKRGYGFLAPDEGGEDVFVHQNNINMEGFRHLRVGERVSYELEVGEKGMKAVSVALLEPRAESPREYDGPRRDSSPRREFSGGRNAGGSGSNDGIDKLRRTQERLISLLVEKGVLIPGELESFNG